MDKIFENPLKLFLLLAFVVLGLALAVMFFFRPQQAQGGAFPGSVAQIGVNNTSASTTRISLLPHTATQLIGTTTCAARIITTTSYPVRLSFYDGAPSLHIFGGHLQAASSTEHYDGEQFGCGVIKAFALIDGGVASSSITISETQ